MKDKEYYKERIAGLINNVNSVSTLRYICAVIESYLKDRDTHDPTR